MKSQPYCYKPLSILIRILDRTIAQKENICNENIFSLRYRRDMSTFISRREDDQMSGKREGQGTSVSKFLLHSLFLQSIFVNICIYGNFIFVTCLLFPTDAHIHVVE